MNELLIASKNLLAALKAKGEYAVEHEGKESWNGDIFATLLIDAVLAEDKLKEVIKKYENK